MVKENISFKDFSKLDIRIGTIIQAQEIQDSNKLLKLTIDFKTFQRQIIAGIKDKYQPSQILSKQVPVILNLEPKKIMGFESQGMLLAIGNDDLEGLLFPSQPVMDGAKVH